MSNSSTDGRLCREKGCLKPAAEGWMICDEHVEKRLAKTRCRHGVAGKAPCIDCLSESLLDEAVTTLHSIPENELLALTARLAEHPQGWEHPCMCATCRSYADG